MQAFELIIDSKVKTSPFTIVSIADFEFHKGQSQRTYQYRRAFQRCLPWLGVIEF